MEELKTNKKIEQKKEQLILEVVLILNKEMFNEDFISYKIYKQTEENILKKLKEYLS